MADKKIKVLTISDHPLLPSGVGTQTKYVIDALVDSGKFQVVSLGGAVKHEVFDPIKPREDWVIFPVDGYGTQQDVIQHINQFQPDILYFMTDPRFYEWLWMIEDSIRPNVPMIYYHVWDNYPYPQYNKASYDSNDFIATISKVTSDIVQTVSPDVEEEYVPHAVDSSVFQSLPEDIVLQNRNNIVPGKEFVCFWNNRNARRKQSGTLVHWWKDFLDQEHIDESTASLVMHTSLQDPHGQPLHHLAEILKLNDDHDKQIVFSTEKVAPPQLAALYNLADCTINIADAEGFGLATLESLSCETPIIVTMTGGLQEQVTDGENWFGVGLEPASKVVIGSQQVPYIHEDRVSREDFLAALNKMYAMSKEEREDLGKKGRQHVEKNYNFTKFNEQWVSIMERVHRDMGSWDNRKGYTAWKMETL